MKQQIQRTRIRVPTVSESWSRGYNNQCINFDIQHPMFTIMESVLYWRYRHRLWSLLLVLLLILYFLLLYFYFYFVGIDNPSPNIKQQLKQTNISHFHSHFYNVGYRKIKSHIRNYESYYLSFKTIDEIQVWQSQKN